MIRKESYFAPITTKGDFLSQSIDSGLNKRKASFALPPILASSSGFSNSNERRQSIWNSAPRKSIFGKRFSFSFSNRKSSRRAFSYKSKERKL